MSMDATTLKHAVELLVNVEICVRSGEKFQLRRNSNVEFVKLAASFPEK